MTRRALLLLVAAASLPAAAPIGARIRAAIQSSPVARTAFWGIEILDLASGRRIFDWNRDHFFVPASNTKLFTTALALTRLGPDYRVATSAAMDGPDLLLIGRGDANLSGRPIPYEKSAPAGDPLAAIEDLASQIYAHGIRRIEGNVVGDDSAFLYEPYPEGWSIDDPIGDDGPPVSALTINDNTILLQVAPGDREGAPATISFIPALPVFEVQNHLISTSAEPKKIHVDRAPGSRELRLWGTIPLQDGGSAIPLSVDDPARFAALALADALQRRGVIIAGTAVARHTYPPGPPPGPARSYAGSLAERSSPPLLEDLRVTDKVSQNLHAEILLRLVGHGSLKEGLAEMQTFLDEVGIDRKQYSFHDGSGLSRLNVVTPHAIIQLLEYMARSNRRESWMELLPVSGVDGSLANRFITGRAKGQIHAKTGTLSHANALSGYAHQRDGRVVAFSIMVNNYNGPASEVRAVIDRIVSLVLE